MTSVHDTPDLLPQHQQLIDGSAVSLEVARERGYRSITNRSELRRLGYTASQIRVPALLLPVHGVHGEIANFQIRPDEPRINARGKPVKYETPHGSHMVLDVPPRCRTGRWISDPNRPLVITEGIRKADAAVSVGICAVALLGVWNWRGTNDQGGSVALADWESVALKRRRVYICFDSDVMTKAAVHAALVRLKEFLEGRSADVSVIYLAPAEGGTKVGLDDFLAAVGTVEQLLSLATNNVREVEGSRLPAAYAATSDGRTVHYKQKNDEIVEETLAYFTAEIVEEVIEDDGAETTRFYKIEAIVGGVTTTVQVPVEKFGSMFWVTEQLGPKAILAAGFGARDRMREAIQTLSPDEIPQVRVYRHLGWAEHGEKWIYLHAGAAIGAEGVVEDVLVRIDAPLDRYLLPPPPETEALRCAVLESLALLGGLAPDRVMFPMFSLTWTTVVEVLRASTHLNGKTGLRKTEIAALFQRHFGAGMDAQHLPGSWTSTGNSLEMTSFYAKDALVTVDDFNPQGSAHDAQRQNREADRFMRAQANGSARGRLRSDGTPRPPKPPRSSVLSTGEDVPAGHSLRARMIVLDLFEGEVNLGKLTERQAAGASYSVAMSGCLRWVAARIEPLRERFRSEMPRIRDRLLAGAAHGRTATACAELLVGLSMFLEFAQTTGAIDAREAARLFDRGQKAMLEVLNLQQEHQKDSDTAQVFVQCIASALQAGDAHLVDRHTGRRPTDEEFARAVGWRRNESSNDSGSGDWRASGPEIGWIEEKTDAIYLNPGPALRAATKQAEGSPTRIAYSERTVWKRLAEAKLLVSTDRERNTLKLRFGKRTENVLHLAMRTLLGDPDAPGTEGTAGTEPADDPAGVQAATVFPIGVPDPFAQAGTGIGNSVASRPPVEPLEEDVPDVLTVPDAQVEADEGGCRDDHKSRFSDPQAPAQPALVRAAEGSPYAEDGYEPWNH